MEHRAGVSTQGMLTALFYSQVMGLLQGALCTGILGAAASFVGDSTDPSVSTILDISKHQHLCSARTLVSSSARNFDYHCFFSHIQAKSISNS